MINLANMKSIIGKEELPLKAYHDLANLKQKATTVSFVLVKANISAFYMVASI
jgi:hypothetical protein